MTDWKQGAGLSSRSSAAG